MDIRPPQVNHQLDSMKFRGGWATESSPLNTPPGRVTAAQNFECGVMSGYTRIAGYERHDGRPAPSAARYVVMNVLITGAFSVGNIITGAISGATGQLIAISDTSTVDYLVFTKHTGTFLIGENLTVAAVVQGSVAAAMVIDGAATPLLRAQYQNLAADVYRADIAAVPGSGEILGVFRHLDVTYAFRNNVGNTAAVMWASSPAGWVAVNLGREVLFTSGGTLELAPGMVITGAISGATATLTHVALVSGDWLLGTAAGKLSFTNQVGVFVAENLNVGATLNVATIAGNSTALSFLPDGDFEFVKYNFGGSENTRHVYGVDGVNRGWEFEGPTQALVFIDTGMVDDAPDHVIGHKNHLFYAFGGSVQHSATGNQFSWAPILGAGELGVGDTVTAFASQPGSEQGGSLSIFCRNRISVLYGNDSADWNLVAYREEVGAYAHTVQDVGTTVFLDDRGVTEFATAQEFGNFIHQTFTHEIKNFINSHRTLSTASCISRDRSQYRLFYSDGYGLYVTTLGRKLIGIMPVVFENVVRCAYSGEDVLGVEEIFFGSDNGFVYQLDKGTSFDGVDINYSLVFAFHFIRSPRFKKRYKAGTFEVTGPSYATFNFSFELGYGSPEFGVNANQAIETAFASGVWDVGVWDVGVWDGRTLLPSYFRLGGSSENISLRIAGASDAYEPFTLHGALLHYIPRRTLR